jgi:hypothetical protein
MTPIQLTVSTIAAHCGGVARKNGQTPPHTSERSRGFALRICIMFGLLGQERYSGGIEKTHKYP